MLVVLFNTYPHDSSVQALTEFILLKNLKLIFKLLLSN